MAEDAPIPAEAVKAQLDRILASKRFANAGRLSRLLQYVVGKTLAGEAEQLKEYSVGIEVFDRNDSYDPRIDSIVRVEAGRLRSRLDEYYNAEGASDAVRITLPRGAYVAQFRQPVLEPAAPAAAVDTPRSRAGWVSWWMTVGLICAVAVMIVWLGGWRSRPETPSIAVLAFEQYPAAGEDGAIWGQLTEAVTSELARLGTVGVVSHTSAMQFAGARKPLREIAQTLDADFILEGSIERDRGGILVVARLVDAQTDRKAWVDDFRGRSDDLRDLSRRIAAAVSGAVAARTASARPPAPGTHP